MEATAPVTVEQAAALLGVSPSTVHRRIRSGALKAEQAQRPQGTVWLVHLPADTLVATDEPSPSTSPEATAPTAAVTPTNQAEALTGLVQATVATVLGPLVVELGASRQTIERQGDTIREQAEQIGTLRAQRDAAQAAHASILAAQAVTPSSEPLVPLWRRWWPAALALAALLVSCVALFWPR